MASSPSSASGNPWFAVSMGLVGLIVGYGVALGMGGNFPISTGGVPAQANNPAPAPSAPAPTPTTDTPPTVDDDPVLGSKDAKVTIIEFTDFQCPFCGRHFTQTFGQIKKDYVDTGKVKYVLRDFPLSFHPNAEKAAETAGCADEQGKFWEMHDKLFTNQGTWSAFDDATAAKTFKGYAKDIGLNQTQFDTCLDSGKRKTEITKDTADGSAAGIDGTPGFWILGPNDQKQKISGAYPYDTFKTAFDNMLK